MGSASGPFWSQGRYGGDGREEVLVGMAILYGQVKVEVHLRVE